MDQNTNQIASGDAFPLKLSKSEELPGKSESHSALAALVQEAYDHPLRTGLEAAAIAGVAAGMAYGAARGRLPFSAAMPEVLLIEDTPGMGNAFKDALEANGSKVTWVTGIKSLKPLTGFSPEGGEVPLSKRFQVAFVDGDLGKDRLTGPEIVGSLRDGGKIKAIIGTSTTDDFNMAMRQNGAPLAIAGNKAAVYAQVLGQRFDLASAVKTPAAVQDGFKAFLAARKAPENAELIKEANDKLTKYLLGN